MTDHYYKWPNQQLDIRDKIAHLRERALALSVAATSLGEGVGVAYRDTGLSALADLYASFAGCLELLAGKMELKRGDRVRLVDPPACEGGWAASKHFLVAGAVGTVVRVEVDYLMRNWWVAVCFDDESWVSSFDCPPHKKGDVVPVPPERRHTYGLTPSRVERIEEAASADDAEAGA